MTTTHARTPNEQRIEALEVEVVTMRDVLVSASLFVDDLGCLDDKCEHPECLVKKQIRTALADSADYANKVVMDAEVAAAVELFLGSRDKETLIDTFARFDSLRKADAATDAVHIEGGKT